MGEDGMVTVGGVRYRVEDAVRLGLVPAPDVTPEVGPKGRTPANKVRTPANKGV